MPAVVAQGNVPLVDEGRSVLEAVTSTEARLAVTATLLVLTLVLAVIVAPVGIRRVSRLVMDQVLSGRVSETVEYVTGYMPTTVGGLVLRVVQLSLVVLAVVGVLTVWGLFDVAATILVLLAASVPFAAQLFATAALGFLSYVAIDVLEDAIDQFSARSERVTEHQEEIMLRMGQLGIISLFVAGTLTIWRIDLSGLLVGAGFLGIVVGLAARQTLGSLIAGFVLMFSRPFTIGDWVEVGDQEGIVTDITIINTRIENFDGEFVVIPNDQVSNQPITNRSRKGLLRLRLDVGVDYGTDIEQARELALDAIKRCSSVVDAPPPQVFPKDFGDSAITLEVRFWIDHPTPPRKWQAQSDVIAAIKDAYDEAGIQIPFPQRVVTGRTPDEGQGITPEGTDVESLDEDDASTDDVEGHDVQ